MEKYFQYVNSYPMPLWLGMMFAPRHPLTERASRSTTIFALAGLNYAIALVLAIRSNAAPKGGSFFSLEGIHNLMGHKPGALAAWSHMLALDLFAGAWVYRECQRLDAPAQVRVPALFGTLMAGPIGLMVFLVWRMFAGGGEAIEEAQ